jgi:riboflavin synthase
MFTGLVEAVGRIERIDESSSGRRLQVATVLGRELQAGDSIATSGVCLTVTAADSSGFAADVSPETLRVTSFGSLEPGRPVNLERPLKAQDRLGGHFVLGHVDAVGRVAAIRQDGEAYWVEIEYPSHLSNLLISKGSVAVDGVSLTVASLDERCFGLQLIPYTWEHTSLKYLKIGDPVNLEADVLGKYVARLVDSRMPTR